ncbi:MAG: hypothetical protein EHM83_07425 [Burkholderiales bacterium]|nr:MAG: hypothetical protein EHM83_07425 [Burkholderiales bacterium]
MDAPASRREAVSLSDRIEAATHVDLYVAAPTGLATGLGLRAGTVAGTTLLMAPGLPRAGRRR